MKFRLIFYTFILTLIPHTAFAQLSLDSLNPIKIINNEINSAIGGMAKTASAEAAEEFRKMIEPMINRLFSEQLPDIIALIDGVAQNEIELAEKAVNRVTNNLNLMLKDCFDYALLKTKNFSIQITQDLRTQIIEYSFNRLNTFRSDVKSDLLYIIDDFFEQARCLTISGDLQIRELSKLIIEDIKTVIPFKKPKEFYKNKIGRDCLNLLGIQRHRSISDYSLSDRFRLWKCVLLRSHDLNTPASTIRAHYTDIEFRCRQLICLTLDTPEAKKLYIEEFIDASRRSQIWRKAME